jgi:AcrR family transcriptional regulator
MDVKRGRHGERSRREQNTEATRGALLRVARDFFTRYGYDGAKTEQIVRRARVTRGALYHHFRGKKDLFREVVEQLEGELVGKVASVAIGRADIWATAVASLRAFLDACMEPAVQRIVLLDAPSVLGYDTWREIDERYGIALIRSMLEEAMAQGVIHRQPVDALAHVMLGALNEGALLIARSDDPRRERREVEESLRRLMEGLRTAPSGDPPA